MTREFNKELIAMNKVAKTALLALALGTTMVTPGSFAQQADLQMNAIRLVQSRLHDWMPPANGSSAGVTKSPSGTVGIMHAQVQMPYSEIISFYVDKYGLKPSETFKSASLFENKGSTSTSSGPVSVALSNSTQEITATFVRIDPDGTTTTTLSRSVQDERTSVTVTRIELPQLVVPPK